ncbi:MAG: hypothetical protein HQK98_08960 [Nitrospirae bacterium]|nr:hypothetical protein [Nitrospirota bacterium]
MKVTRLDDRRFSDKIWAAKEGAREWTKKNIEGKSFTNKDTGWDVTITGKGIRKVLSGNKEDALNHIEAVRAIPDLLENAVLTETHIEINDKLYRVKLTIKETNDGKMFYDQA